MAVSEAAVLVECRLCKTHGSFDVFCLNVNKGKESWRVIEESSYSLRDRRSWRKSVAIGWEPFSVLNGDSYMLFGFATQRWLFTFTFGFRPFGYKCVMYLPTTDCTQTNGLITISSYRLYLRCAAWLYKSKSVLSEHSWNSLLIYKNGWFIRLSIFSIEIFDTAVNIYFRITVCYSIQTITMWLV